MSFIILTILSNILLLFNICESLVNSFHDLAQLVYTIVVNITLDNKDLRLKDELALNVSVKYFYTDHQKMIY